MLGDQASSDDRNQLRQELGLNRPVLPQYTSYLGQVFTLDLGTSLVTRDPVIDDILHRFPATVELSLAALLFGILWGLPLGVWAAVYPRSLWSWLTDAVGLIGMSVPGIFLGPA